ncbi:hypothetical protein AC249_AIPGENE17254, partial [Exaiptasia diaphana]
MSTVMDQQEPKEYRVSQPRLFREQTRPEVIGLRGKGRIRLVLVAVDENEEAPGGEPVEFYLDSEKPVALSSTRADVLLPQLASGEGINRLEIVESDLWILGKRNLYRLDDGGTPSLILSDVRATAVVTFDGNTYIGTTQGLLRLGSTKPVFDRHPVTSLAVFEGRLWIGTPWGLFVLGEDAPRYRKHVFELKIIGKSLWIASAQGTFRITSAGPWVSENPDFVRIKSVEFLGWDNVKVANNVNVARSEATKSEPSTGPALAPPSRSIEPSGAYSDASRPPIPIQVGHPFRRKSAIDSDSKSA